MSRAQGLPPAAGGRVPVHAFLGSVAAGLLIGLLAGGLMAVRTTEHNVIGFTVDSLILGLYLAGIYGLVSGLAGALLGVPLAAYAAFVRRLSGRGAYALAFGLLLAGYLFLSGMRSYNEDLYYFEYAFINSLREMQLFFAARTALIALVSAAAGYLAWRFSRRAPRATAAALFLIAFVIALIGHARSIQPDQEPAAHRPPAFARGELPPLLMVGWDGATWHVIDRLIAEGKLPHTQRLIAGGTRGNLGSPAHVVSPEIWTTIFTGKEGRKHGIYGFDYYIIPGISRPLAPPWRGLGVTRLMMFAMRHQWIDVVISNCTLRRATPLWNIMNAMGRSAGIVGPLVTWPAEAVEPFLISSVAGDVARKIRRGRLDPEAFAAEDLFYPPDLDPWVRQQILADERWRSRVAPYLYRRYRPDFFTVYFGEPDGTQHKRWKWMEPQYYANVTAAGLERYADAIEREYTHADSVLGQLLATAGDTTTVIVISDHGFSPAYRGGVHQAGHYHGPDGILIAYGPPIRSGFELEGAHVNDIAPTVLALCGLPIAEDMDGDALTAMIRPDFLARHPLRTTPTYEFDPTTAEVRRSRAEDEIYEKLRSLGYIGE